MTVYQELNKIKQSLLNKIEQFSHKERLSIIVQTEEYEFGADTVVLLFDSNDLLLLDETYTVEHLNPSQASVSAHKLLANVTEWVEDMNVDVKEDVREVCYSR